MPRWIKVFAIAAAALLLVALAVMLFSGGQHGPARHTPSTGERGVGSATASAAAAHGADRFRWVDLR